MNKYSDDFALFLGGMKKMAELVGSTTGPFGSSVTFCGTGLGKNEHPLKTTKDGIRIAEAYLPTLNQLEREAALRLVDAARSTVGSAGDGTSLTILLCYHLYERGLLSIADGMMPMLVSKFIRAAGERTIAAVRKQAVRDVGRSHFEKVGRVAMKGLDIGAEIGGIVYDLGESGVLLPELGAIDQTEVRVEVSDGFRAVAQMDESFFEGASRVMLNDAMVLFSSANVGGSINNGQWGRLFDAWNARCRAVGQMVPLVLVAPDVEGTVLGTFKARRHGTTGQPIPLYFIRVSPALVSDMATYVGARCFHPAEGLLLDDYGTGAIFGDPLGYCNLYVENGFVTVRGGDGDAEALGLLKDRLQGLLAEAQDGGAQEALRSRLAALSGKIGVLKVPSITRSGWGDLAERLDDAYRASRSIWKHGVLPGGGAGLYCAADVDYFKAVARDVAYRLWANAGVSQDDVFAALNRVGVGEALVFAGGADKAGYVGIERADDCSVYDSAFVIESAIRNAVDVVCPLIETKYFLYHD